MKRKLLAGLLLINSLLFAQNNNGLIDQLEEVVTVQNIQVPMPDGTKLSTDLFLPIFADSLVVPIDLLGFGVQPLEILSKGTQYIYYPEKNGAPNPNPYQLPFMFTRTTYDKSNGTEFIGIAAALLGYGGMVQDTRGVYDSEGVYGPLYSDSWEKTPYFSKQLPIDIFPASHPSNFNNHADGVHALDYLLDSLYRDFDIDDDGIVDLNDKLCNGSVGMLGASALANPQYQLSAARRIDPNGPGLKGLLNLIASNEHYNHTLYNNGVFREKLVKFWIDNQIDNFDNANIPFDTTTYNNIHSAADYNQTDIAHVTDSVLDLLTVYKIDDSLASYYPNADFRYVMDASEAPVDNQGMGDINGTKSRYTNCEVPQYHFTGWYDIFTSGQISSWRNLRNELDPSMGNQDKQFLTIGPWAHTTITTQSTGDITYPANVGDVVGFTVDINNFDINNININVDAALNTELLSFLRTSLNYNSYANVGEPQIRLPETNKYQEILPNTLVRIPAEDYEMTHADLINFLGGHSGLPGMRVKVFQEIEINLIFFTYIDTVQVLDITVDIPQLPINVLDLLGGMQNPISSFPGYNDFNQTAALRAYIIGPQNDGVAYNANAGNYWMERDSFPFNSGITWNKLFLHGDGSIDTWAPDSSEATNSYIHDPNNPVFTIGGHNMLIETPTGEESRGQMNLANPAYDSITMNHPGVIQFETDWLSDSVSVIGYPQAKLFASSLPQGANLGDPTNTDFVVRIVDVYPTGEEYYVIEGVVNARAREYAKSIAEGQEDNNAPYSNIASDKVYEFHFELLPIGYTFGKDHKIKVLISSSNHPKYQSNPNIPLEDGDFFRWAVGENKSYNFEGIDIFPRVAENSVHFAPNYPSYVTFPLFGNSFTNCAATDSLWVDTLSPFSVELHWAQVEGVASYTVAYQENGASVWDSVEVYGTSYVLDSLEQETAYAFNVTSDCLPKSSSPTYSFVTDEYCVPADSLTVLDLSDSTALVSWDGVDFAPGYTVYFGLASDSLTSWNVSDTSYLFENLLDDTTYVVVIQTECDFYLEFSDSLTFTTLATPVDTVSGIQSLALGGLAVYPNPFNNQLALINNSSTQRIIDIRVVDVAGRVVWTDLNLGLQAGGEYLIDGSTWSAGYYAVHVKSVDGVAVIPLVKKE